MQKGTGFKKSKPGYYNYKSPLLFFIPLNVYSDEVGRQRDKESFLKLQKLEKKCEKLRQSFSSFAEQHSARIEKTKYLAFCTVEVNNNIRGRRVKY
ncbi:hypothetical protein [Segetibacter sp.]|jgi:hypothetical protein|uniref:hypothetical protein n=1 Tax=Segetibacter sp. TaxID=2231182 RepID=UPI00262434A0|nr:hypothetical protein [Segetibacter sp.]MCW3080988.1 hypothetical protein [Segetibacter sp.]